jgi:putative oxidoreductase
MSVVRRVARPMLASMFIVGGLDALLEPAPKAPTAEPVAVPLARQIPYLPDDPEQLVMLNGGVQVAAGTMLALGVAPRLSSTVLAMSLVPTTWAGHRFWEENDPAKKKQQRVHFFKNVGMLGGLLLAAVDTEGNPSLAWRAHHAVDTSRRIFRTGKREAKLAAKLAKLEAKLTKLETGAKVRSLAA